MCFGTREHRRIGRHRLGMIGKAFAYGHRVLRVGVCIYCDRAGVIG